MMQAKEAACATHATRSCSPGVAALPSLRVSSDRQPARAALSRCGSRTASKMLLAAAAAPPEAATAAAALLAPCASASCGGAAGEAPAADPGTTLTRVLLLLAVLVSPRLCKGCRAPVKTIRRHLGGGSWRTAASAAADSADGTSVTRGASTQSRQSQKTMRCRRFGISLLEARAAVVSMYCLSCTYTAMSAAAQ